MRCTVVFLHTVAVLLVFTAAGACSPRFRRRFDELRNQVAAARAAKEELRGDPTAFEEAASGIPTSMKERQTRGAAPGGDARGLVNPNRLEEELSTSIGELDPSLLNLEQDSPEWNIAMINFLLNMKAKGHKINEIEMKKPLSEIHRELQNSQATGNGVDPLVCKTAPYNICYRLDHNGVLHPIGDRRPVRILRVY